MKGVREVSPTRATKSNCDDDDEKLESNAHLIIMKISRGDVESFLPEVFHLPGFQIDSGSFFKEDCLLKKSLSLPEDLTSSFFNIKAKLKSL